VRAQGDGYANTAKGPQAERLVLWTRSSPDNPNTEWENITNVANAYTEQTGTPTELATVPNDSFKSNLAIAGPGGEGPDVYGPIAHDWIGEFQIQGLAAEIPAELIEGRDDIIPVALDALTTEGKLSALPIFVESVALVYNADMVPTPPATWEELVAIATELTAGDGYVFRYEDGTFFTDDVGLNNEGSAQAARFLRDMYHQKQPPLPEVAIDRTNMHVQQDGMMEVGQIAMTIQGPWREVPLTTAGINYGVARLPTLPGGSPIRPFLGV
jgi:maltose-binding protein MalE